MTFSSEQKNATSKVKVSLSRRTAAALFAGIALMWIAFDMLTKAYFNSGAFYVGQQIAGPFLGIFEFLLVHNTGAAWGIFGDSTFALGVFSVFMCAAILAFFVWLSKSVSAFEVVGLALVFAGGIGNAIDRFTLGYVVDFINACFIQFPVFNIADIGVTCGVVIFLVSFLLGERYPREDADKGEEILCEVSDIPFEEVSQESSCDAVQEPTREVPHE